MELLSLNTETAWAVLALLVILVFVVLGKSSTWRGRLGEALLQRELEAILDGESFRFLHDLTLPDYDGTTQIDHVLVSPFGVFVIEAKNFSGWIYGSANQRTWTHVFRRRKYRFQNPLHQSFNHLKTVQKIGGLRANQIHSLVVFVGRGQFKTDMPENVIKISGLRKFFWSKSDVVLSDDEIQAVVNQIEEQRLRRGFLTNRRHRKHIREVMRRPLCPSCKSRMVVRTARRGVKSGQQFWGCSRYPRCKGTREME